MKVSSPAFADGGRIPPQFTCDGDETSPPLAITGIPEGTITMALIMEDPDAPGGAFDHWIAWNIDPVKTIEAGTRPGIQGRNSGGKTGYHGPCPPRGAHHYHFSVYALDARIELPAGASKQELINEMKNHILAQGRLTGIYERSAG